MQNNISTNTNLIVFNRERHMRTMVELVPIYAEHGLKLLDLNFCEMMNPQSVLKNRDKAREYIARLKSYKTELDVQYIQCHLPYPVKGKNPYDIDDISIALEYVSELDIPVSVIHPIRGTVDDNIRYFESIKPFIPSSTTLAIENMENKEEVYQLETILEIIEGLSFNAGICLDTGHANMTGIDIPSFIETAGNRLLATHIADNNGIADQHLLPGFGNIDWEKILPYFKKYYNGYLNYEAMFFSRNVTEKVSKEIIELAKAIGSWLLDL